MRILLCIEHFFGDVHGGAYRVAWDCAKYLARTGHEVTLLCESKGGDPAHSKIEGVSVLRYGLTKRGWNVASIRRKLVESLVRNHYGGHPPEMIWGHSPFQFLGAIAAFPHCAAVYTVHSPVSEEMRESERYTRWFSSWKIAAGKIYEKKCLQRARRIIVLSQFTCDLLARIHRTRFESKIVIAPGWVDAQNYITHDGKTILRGELAWRTDVPVLFCLRRLVPRMGIGSLIQAAAILRKQGMQFVLYIGGEGAMRQTLLTQIEREGVGEQVKLVGAIPEQQLAVSYAACDAFVIPTRALECFGLIAVEAMAAGTVVLSTPVGALPEIIRPLEPRWLAQDNSAEAIALLIKSFLEGNLPEHSGDEIRRYVTQHYDARTACARFCELAIGNSD